MAIDKNSKVKFSVFGGLVYATIVSIHDAEFDFNGTKVAASKTNPIVIIQTPLGQRDVKPLTSLIEVNDEDYSVAIAEVIKTLSHLIGKKDDQTMSKELETIKNEVDSLKKDLEAAKAKLDEISKEKDSLANTVKDAQAKEKLAIDENAQLKAKVADFEKKILSAQRLGIMKGFDFVEGDETKVADEYANMSAEAFEAVKKIAEVAYRKLTEMTKTNLSKLTDQTKTGDPKLTDQTKAEEKAKADLEAEKVKAALEKAEADKKEVVLDPKVNSVADDSLMTGMAKIIGRGKKSKESKK